MPIRFYAETSSRAARQLAADLLALAWVLFWVWAGVRVHAAVGSLAAPGRDVEEAGTGLAGRLREAGASVESVPVAGETLRGPLDGAAGAADQLAAAGTEFQARVADLALLLGISFAVLPILLLLVVWLPPRLRWVLRSRTLRRAAARPDGADVLALRALLSRPLDQLPPGAADGWRRRDAEIVRRLAALELAGSGLRLDSPGP